MAERESRLSVVMLGSSSYEVSKLRFRDQWVTPWQAHYRAWLESMQAVPSVPKRRLAFFPPLLPTGFVK